MHFLFLYLENYLLSIAYVLTRWCSVELDQQGWGCLFLSFQSFQALVLFEWELRALRFVVFSNLCWLPALDSTEKLRVVKCYFSNSLRLWPSFAIQGCWSWLVIGSLAGLWIPPHWTGLPLCTCWQQLPLLQSADLTELGVERRTWGSMCISVKTFNTCNLLHATYTLVNLLLESELLSILPVCLMFFSLQRCL